MLDLFLLQAFVLSADPAENVSDRELSRRTREIIIEREEPPLMALETLRSTSLMMKPYLPCVFTGFGPGIDRAIPKLRGSSHDA
jgi:hypothetical protein